MNDLVHVSLFSGIGGIDLAMHRAGIPTVLACEFDKAAAGVLADRFPGTLIHPDVRTLTGDDLRRVADPARTVLSAGFPCQDVSVAGGRRGMGEGTRSGLFWEADRLLREFAPAWVVLENVPGLLSAVCVCPGDERCQDTGRQSGPCGDTVRRAGRAEWVEHHWHTVPGGACAGGCIATHGGVMGAVLGSLAERGYGFAYRVLDARHFGVPQRRRRVVVVGRLGDDGTAPARVLLEPEGLLGDPTTGHQARPVAAASPGGSAAAGRVTRALTTRSGAVFDDQQVDQLVVGVLGDHTHALTAEGSDASEDGTGRGTPIVAAPAVAATLSAGTSSRGVAVAFHLTQDPISGQQSPAMGAKSGGMGIAYAAEQTVSLDTAQGGPDDNAAQGGHLVATFQKVIRSGARDQDGNLPPEVWAHRDVAATLNLNDLGSESRVVEVDGHLDSPEIIVRRFTPTECERLQGCPDGWTAMSGGREQADSPRYRQLGNSVAVPVFEWVARRIVAEDSRITRAAA